MANQNDYEGLDQTKRISPFMEMSDDDVAYEEEYAQDDYARNADEKGKRDASFVNEYEPDDDEEYEAEYEDEEYEEYEEYDDEYDEAYEEEYDGEYDEEDEQRAGFFSTLPGRIVLGIIALLLVVVIALLAMKLLGGKDEQKTETENLPAAVEVTKTPASIVFAPDENEEEETPEPTAEPVVEETPAPTAKPSPTPTPEPTATPLPIILTNTPTPSPSPTPTLEPTPTPTPSPTPTPAPTAVPELAKGETNRKANLRETASSSGKVKETLKQGEVVTIHEAILDKSGKIWYGLTVDDLNLTGWMRDYVVTPDEAIAKPTYTPQPAGTPKAPVDEAEEDEAEKTPEKTPEPLTMNENAIGSGKTKKDTNVRKVMNGKVLTQLRKGRRVDILSVRMDKKGEIWYEVQPHNSKTVGFVRDYLIQLDKGVELIMPTATPKPAEEEPEEKAEEAVKETEEEKAEAKEESILDREVIGKAKTNRAANVRVKPVSGSKLVRQLSKGVELLIIEKYQDKDGNIWYEVSTDSGRTHGFVRDYLLKISEIDQTREAKTYEAE